MILPDGYSIRAVDPARDLAPVSALYLAGDLADLGEPDHQDDWIVQTWRDESVRAWVVERGSAAVGYLELESRNPASVFDAYLLVHPDERAGRLRAALLDGAEDGARAGAEAPEVVLRVTGAASDPSFAADVVAAGFAKVRTFVHMERALEPAHEPGPPPAGVTIRPSIDPEDDQSVYRVLDEGFRGHFGIEPMTFASWRSDFKDGMYEPGLVLLAEADGRPVGVAANWLPDGIGWIGDLAVVESHRRRGIGAALLRRSFAALAARGATQVRLNVDAANGSGATRLYASVGMAERRRFHVYEKRVRTAG